MSASSDPYWGPDLLASDQVVEVGTGVTFGNITPGLWDLAVFDSSGNCKIFMQQQFDAGGQYELDVTSGEWTVPYECPDRH